MLLQIKKFHTGMHYVELNEELLAPFRTGGKRRVVVTAVSYTHLTLPTTSRV